MAGAGEGPDWIEGLRVLDVDRPDVSRRFDREPGKKGA